MGTLFSKRFIDEVVSCGRHVISQSKIVKNITLNLKVGSLGSGATVYTSNFKFVVDINTFAICCDAGMFSLFECDDLCDLAYVVIAQTQEDTYILTLNLQTYQKFEFSDCCDYRLMKLHFFLTGLSLYFEYYIPLQWLYASLFSNSKISTTAMYCVTDYMVLVRGADERMQAFRNKEESLQPNGPSSIMDEISKLFRVVYLEHCMVRCNMKNLFEISSKQLARFRFDSAAYASQLYAVMNNKSLPFLKTSYTTKTSEYLGTYFYLSMERAEYLDELPMMQSLFFCEFVKEAILNPIEEAQRTNLIRIGSLKRKIRTRWVLYEKDTSTLFHISKCLGIYGDATLCITINKVRLMLDKYLEELNDFVYLHSRDGTDHVKAFTLQ